MKKYAFGWMMTVALLYSPARLYAVPQATATQDTVIVKFSVSEQQEKNFNAFMAWLEKHKSLAKNDSLKMAYQDVFAALKKNDGPKYFIAIKQLDRALARVTGEEKEDMYSFFLTLTPVKDSSSPENGNESLSGTTTCNVSCLFGSGKTTCPPGTKPKCFCQWGVPHTGCEPYDVK